MYFCKLTNLWYESEVFIQLEDNLKNNSVFIKDDVMKEIVNRANKEQLDILSDKNGYPILVERIYTEKEKLENEYFQLKFFLKDSEKYIYQSFENGGIFKEDYPEIFKQRQEAKNRIKELEILTK